MFHIRRNFGYAIAASAMTFAVAAVSTEATAGSKEKVLHGFTGYSNGQDGSFPYGSVVRDDAGNLYGTTFSGGANDYGTVFKLSPNGKETILHSFSQNGDEGVNPVAGVIVDKKGNIYGTTRNGGTQNAGALFKLTPQGTVTTIHVFAGGGDNNKDGGRPQADLVLDDAGNIYGTTHLGGGKGNCNANNCGTVFEFAPDGTETILHAFSGGKDGGYPNAPVIIDAQGNLYGTTEIGGNTEICQSVGCGVVFKISPSGKESVLYAFSGPDGADPVAGLVMDSQGNLFGTTNSGGNANAGVVYKLAPNGKQTVLHQFPTVNGDGQGPWGSLAMDAKGNLYGTTANGGTTNNGVVYEITPKGKITILYSFAGGDDGSYPIAGVILDNKGTIYGTTNRGGGTESAGTVFSLKN